MRNGCLAAIGAIGMAAMLGVACTKGTSSTSAAVGGSSAPAGAAASAVPSPSGYHPVIDPARFTSVVDNPWFPLKPGATWVYRGSKDGEAVREVEVVTKGIQHVDGVPCVAVHDELFHAKDGSLVEDTFDFYTQDRQGNVWYFGEMTVALDDNDRMTDTEGSWMAGQDGAQPGIFMESDPTVGHSFLQEYYPGQAQDTFTVLDVAAHVDVPYGAFDSSLLTQETTVLEPGIVDHKNYVKGVGEVAELQVRGPQPPERSKLVSYTAG
ncbi:MAG TPA: hypothetical protein VKA30_12770 [Actinomycetota bacterium]|nr:hypothetical protein [Actinomycetota bacterium]